MLHLPDRLLPGVRLGSRNERYECNRTGAETSQRKGIPHIFSFPDRVVHPLRTKNQKRPEAGLRSALYGRLYEIRPCRRTRKGDGQKTQDGALVSKVKILRTANHAKNYKLFVYFAWFVVKSICSSTPFSAPFPPRFLGVHQ